MNVERKPPSCIVPECMESPCDGGMEPGAFCALALAAGETGMQAAEIALERSPSADVRAFAMHAMVEHSRTTHALQSIAGGKCPGALNEHCSDLMLHQLEQLDAENFDAAFATSQVAVNEEVVDLLSRTASEMDDVELQVFAQSQLPVFVAQLKQAQALEAAHPAG